MSLGVAIVLSLFVSNGRFVQTDFDLTVRLQDNVIPRFDNELAYFVDLGSMEFMTLLLLGITTVLPTKKRYKLAIILAYLLGLVLVWVGKETLHHPAPPFLFHRGGSGLHFPSSYVQIQYSYPSGHTYRTFFVVTLLIATLAQAKHHLAVKLGIALMCSLAAVGLVIALIVLGKHWTTDVIGGASLAVAFASGASLLLSRFNTPPKNNS